eukprot:3552936-Ditylum_brightwellii.AAC.1
MPINQQHPGKKCNDNMGIGSEIKGPTGKNDFINSKDVSWQPTESSAPFYVETTDGTELWYGPYCHGVVG